MVDRPVPRSRQEFLIRRVGVADHRAAGRVPGLVLPLPPVCNQLIKTAKDTALFSGRCKGGKLGEMGERDGRQGALFAPELFVGEQLRQLG